MKAAVLQEPGKLKIIECSVPSLQSDWALIKVKAAGICGSDLHFYKGDFPAGKDAIRGHEIAGTVVNSGCTNFIDGESVIVHPLLGCNNCSACLKGNNHLCDNLSAIGGDYPGGFAEYVAVPEKNLYRFDQRLLSFEHAALADCVAVALHAMKKINIKSQDTVGIIGDGAVGLLLIQLAKIYGAAKIILFGKHDYNLQIGKELGATEVYYGRDGYKLVSEEPGFVGFDVLFEAAGGVSPPYKEALFLLKKGAKLGLLGFTEAQMVEVPWQDIVVGEKSVIGIMGYSREDHQDELREAISLMEEGAVQLQSIITGYLPLSEIDKGFQKMLDKKKSRTIKVIIKPNSDPAE